MPEREQLHSKQKQCRNKAAVGEHQYIFTFRLLFHGRVWCSIYVCTYICIYLRHTCIKCMYKFSLFDHTRLSQPHYQYNILNDCFNGFQFRQLPTLCGTHTPTMCVKTKTHCHTCIHIQITYVCMYMYVHKYSKLHTYTAYLISYLHFSFNVLWADISINFV